LELVLVAVADDYESPDNILTTINEADSDWGPDHWEARDAIPVSGHEVIHAVGELTREGYAQAYQLDSGEAEAVRFNERMARDLWYCATPKGMNAIRQLYERA